MHLGFQMSRTLYVSQNLNEQSEMLSKNQENVGKSIWYLSECL